MLLREAKIFTREKHPSCRGLRNTLSRMKRNLRSLQGKTSRKGSGSKRKRHLLLRAMKRQNCSDTRQASIKRTSILDQIFGSSENKRRRQRARKDRRSLKRTRKNHRNRERSTEERLYNYNTVRTVCVRTCDGYYFPVSFSTNKRSLNRDSESCNNLCPGTDRKLYYHKTSGQGVEEMISIEDGNPYTSLPSAFAYRKSYNPAAHAITVYLNEKWKFNPANQIKTATRRRAKLNCP